MTSLVRSRSVALATALLLAGSSRTHADEAPSVTGTGFVMSSGEEVKIAPRDGALVAIVLPDHAGQPIEASGFGTQNQFGTVVDAASLIVGGETIPLQPGPPGPR